MMVVVMIAKLQFLSNRCVFNNPTPPSCYWNVKQKRADSFQPPNTTCFFSFLKQLLLRVQPCANKYERESECYYLVYPALSTVNIEANDLTKVSPGGKRKDLRMDERREIP